MFGAGMALLLVWLGLSLAFVVDQMSRATPGNVWIGPIVLGLFFGPFALIFALKGWRGRHLRIDLHDHGVAYAEGVHQREVAWDDVRSVVFESHDLVSDLGFGIDVTTRRVAKLVIQAPFQPAIVIDERFPNHHDLVAVVHQASAEAMLPRFEAALQAGHQVTFGPLVVHQLGIGWQHGGLGWNEIGTIGWEPRGASACYAVYDTQGALCAEFDTALENRLVFEGLLARAGKLREAWERKAPTVDRVVGAARRALAS
jgi:hypothetical protein